MESSCKRLRRRLDFFWLLAVSQSEVIEISGLRREFASPSQSPRRSWCKLLPL
jgi:hypothetical protein